MQLIASDDSEKALYGPPVSEAEGIGALTLGGFLLEVCERYGDNEALVFHDPTRNGARVSWTYSDLQRQCWQVGKALIAAGVNKGSRVGIIMGSRPECVAAIFGAGLAGAIAVPLSTLAAREELEYLIRHADIDTLITQTSLGGKHRPLDGVLALCPEAATAAPGNIRSAAFPYLRRLVALGADSADRGVQSWDDFIGSAAAVDDAVLSARNDDVSSADAGLIIYSSGTTAEPKGMLHIHRAPTMQAWQQARIFRRTPETRMWTTFPLFWTAGFNTAMGATLAAGACWVMQELFDAGEALELMANERVSEPYALPHHTAALEEHPAWVDADLSSLRCINYRSPFTRHPAVTRANPDWYGVWGYGASETCAISVTHYADTPLEISRKSTGRLLPGNILRVVEPDTGEVLGAGQEGEFCLKGPTLMDRYVKKQREECFDEDGFFHTGDSGYYDEDGNVHWTGRLSDMIKTAGANVSPAELEQVILGRFSELKLSRVVGIPDERLGQSVVLCAVLKEGASLTEEEIKQGLRERVASYKVPRHVLFFAEEEIPMTASSKVKDAELRQIAQQRLAAQSGKSAKQ